MASSKKTKSGSGFFAKYKKYIIPAIIIIAVLVAYFAFCHDVFIISETKGFFYHICVNFLTTVF